MSKLQVRIEAVINAPFGNAWAGACNECVEDEEKDETNPGADSFKH